MNDMPPDPAEFISVRKVDYDYMRGRIEDFKERCNSLEDACDVRDRIISDLRHGTESKLVADVAKGIREAVPGLVNPEAWPWRTMAEAAMKAMMSAVKPPDSQ